MKKITFIEPASPTYHIFSRYALPRLGLPILGTMLKERGYEVSIYVEDIHPIDYSEVYKSDLVGISTITSTAPQGYKIAQKIREKGIPVIMGGVHVTFLPEEALRYVDYVVRGEGEETLMELIERLEARRSVEGVLGISYKIDGEYRHNPDRPRIQNLDSVPFPDFSLIKGLNKLSITPVLTSRGCPFNCTFCSVTTMFGRKYRFRSADSVFEEIVRHAPKTNPKWFFFYDDNFTANPERTKELLEKLIRKRIKISWTAQTRADVAKDKELLELMKRTNCWFLYIGFESVNPKTLEIYNKRQLLEEIKESIKVLHKYNIRVHGMFVLGSDEDNLETIRKTVQFANRNKIDTVQFLILTPIPGSKLHAQMEKEKRIITKEWSLYDGFHVVFAPAKMTAYRLQVETVKAMRKFYSLFKCLRLFLKLRFYTALLCVYGNIFIIKWIKLNREFIERLKSWGKKLPFPKL